MSSARHRKENEVVGWRLPPSEEERSFKTFLWNPKTGAVLGRTGASWAKCGLFYLVFYSFLAAYFSILMFIFYQTIDYNIPKYTGAESALTNPGLSYRPRPRMLGDQDLRSIVTYNPSKSSTFGSYVYSLNSFWNPYLSPPPHNVDCLPNDGYRKENGPFCYFDVDTLNTTCSPVDNWGYETDSPCIFLKLNKMLQWKPQPLKSFDGLPEGLQHHINASADPMETLQQNVWVWCESDDVELEQPSPGLPLAFFPYYNQDSYMAPYAPVRFLNLPIKREVKVKCRAWASNIEPKMNGRRMGEIIIFGYLE